MFELAVSDQENLDRLNQGAISHSDYYFARFLASRCEVRNPALISLFADLSHALTEQHSCLNLELYVNSEQLIKALKNTACVNDQDENDDDTAPLVLENNLLFLQKYFQYERRIANRLLSQNRPCSEFDHKELTLQIHKHFPDFEKTDSTDSKTTEIDWQMIAAFQALTNHLTIITGGPGTGKTTTVAKILDIWSALQTTEISPGDIKLAAPTGKAAMRLSQSLAQSASQSNNAIKKDATEKKAIEQVVTVHRLLGYRPQDNAYRHDADNLLRVKLLIIDEVSMLDLAMLDRLLKAVPEDCQLVLIGDPNQLPSVEAGNALMDICNHPAPYSGAFSRTVKTIFGLSLPFDDSVHGLSDAICRLVKSHRFSDLAGVGKAANAILNGQPIESDETILLKSPAIFANSLSPLLEELTPYIDAISNSEIEPLALLDLFETTRILCPVREGRLGVEAINQSIEQTVKRQQNKPSSATGVQDLFNRDNYYHGRPVMILRNDYLLSLFNGDIGICIANSDSTAQGVAFKNALGEIEIFPLSRLPQHETCFAMTIHKAQGSEFDHVSLILGTDLSHSQENLITRELLYTAVTRSRHSVTIYSEPSTLEKALQQRIRRSSGLSNRLLASTNQIYT